MHLRRCWPRSRFSRASFSLLAWAAWALTCAGTPDAQPEPSPSTSATNLADLPLEKLMEIEVPTVYGASKFEQRETEAPSLVTVIGSDEIKKFGYRTLADLLRSVPGLYVTYDRNYAFLGDDGLELGDFNSRFLLLVNGHRINNNLSDGAYIDTAFILDVDLIDHVEVIQGPGSVLYGDNAFFGVINVVSRSGRQLNGLEVSGEYGGYDTFKGRLTYGKLFDNDLELLFSGTIYDSEGADRLYYHEFDTPAQNHGVAEGLDADDAKNAFASARFHDFTLEGAFIHREKNNPTAQYFTTFNDSRLKTTDERGYLALKYAHSFEDLFDVSAQVYYDRADFTIGYPTSVPGGTTLFKETDSGDWWGADLQLSRRFWERLVLTAGAEYRDDFHQHQEVVNEDTGQVFTDIHRERQIYGVFGEGDLTVITNLHLNGGVRYDRFGDFGSALNPRVALIYSPFETSTFKAIYGTAFRAPNFLELALSGGVENLQSEEITSYQLVYEQQIGNHVRASLTGFFNRMDDLIVFQNGAFTNFNVESKGIEVAAEGRWLKALRTRASYTLQEARNISTAGALPDSPQHLAKLNLTVPFYREKIFGSVEFQFTSSRHSLFTTPTGETLVGADAAGFGIVNLTLFSQDLIKNLEFSASIYNLLDKKYYDPATRFHFQDLIEQDGRSFRLKLTYRF